jgi:uroporphyrinogen decarboxylase
MHSDSPNRGLDPHWVIAMRLDSKSLVTSTIKRQVTDRIPVGELCIDDALVAAFTGTCPVGFMHQRQVADHLGLDLICLAADYGPLTAHGGLPAADTVRWHTIQSWAGQTHLFIFVLIDGGFAWGIKTWGFQQFAIKVMRRSADIAELLRQIEALNQRLIRQAADLGADGVVIGDDIAYQRGLLLPPDSMKELFLPSLACQAEACHGAGLPVFFHSDGDLKAILNDLAGTGIDGLQGIESAAGMDLAAVKADYGHQLCLWGNLDPACLVEDLSVEAIDGRVGAVLASGARGGGLIFGTSSGLFQGMRPLSIERAYQCAKRIGNRTQASTKMKGKDHARP